MSWTPQTAASLGVWVHPRYGTEVFLGFYLLLVGVIRLWSELLARRVDRSNLDRSLRAFGRVLLAFRFMVPAWFAVGLYLLGWGVRIHTVALRWAPLQLPG